MADFKPIVANLVSTSVFNVTPPAIVKTVTPTPGAVSLIGGTQILSATAIPTGTSVTVYYTLLQGYLDASSITNYTVNNYTTTATISDLCTAVSSITNTTPNLTVTPTIAAGVITFTIGMTITYYKCPASVLSVYAQ